MQFLISEEALKSLKEETRADIAKNATYGKKILKLFLRDDDYSVRKAVAENPNTLSETLEELSRDDDWDVREAAFQNPNTLKDC